MEIKTHEKLHLISFIIGLILCGISIFLNQLMAFQIGLLFVGISVLVFFFDINLRHRLRIYTQIMEIRNPELRHQGYRLLNELEKTFNELASGSFEIVNPFQAREIAFDFLKAADKNTTIFATQDFSSRPHLLDDENKKYFISLNKTAVEQKAQVTRIFSVDDHIRNEPLFIEYCNELANTGCEVYHIQEDHFHKIISGDIMISINRKKAQKSKVLIGEKGKPADEYVAKLSYRKDDIEKYQSKFDKILKSSEKWI